MRKINKIFVKAGKASSKAFITAFIFSFFETIFRGLKALKALNPRIKETESAFKTASNVHVNKEKNTIARSKIFQLSFK